MFEKWFPRKVKEKSIKRFWTDFSEHADLFLNIMQNDEPDSEDYLWMQTLIGKWLKLCCLDSTVGYEFLLDSRRDPPRFVFFEKQDEYLRQVGEKLTEFYPDTLKGKIDFIVAE